MVCFLLVQVVHLYYSITIIYYRWEWQEASDKMYYRNTLGCAGEEAHGGGMHLRAHAGIADGLSDSIGVILVVKELRPVPQ